jgi:two-component system phosphate regulon response regulator PhoB
MLLKAHGRVLTRDILREIVWEDPQEQKYDSRTVDVHVGRLRRKLGKVASYVETVRGVGYRFSISG